MSLRDDVRAAALRTEAAASARLDGETHDVGPVTVREQLARAGAELVRAVSAAEPAQPAESATELTEPDAGTLGALRLTRAQYDALLMPISDNRVRELRGNSHLEAWDVRRYLNRIFGFGGWDLETIELVCVREITYGKGELIRKKRDGGTYANDAPVYTVVYRCQARLTIKNADGTVGAVFEDAASGSGENQPNLNDAHDQAMKTALSQALKRCAVNLGDQFGMSLYSKGNRSAVVVRTLAGPPETATPQPDQIAVSDKVYGEQDGEELLPTPEELRDEALDAGTSIDRLNVIYADIRPNSDAHPALGSAYVTNEKNEQERLAALVYRIGKQRTGGTDRD